MIKIIVDDIIYDSITEAGRQLGLNTTVVLWRLKSKNPNFDNYKYSDDNKEETYKINKSNENKIIIDGIIYNTMEEASKKLKLNIDTIFKRVISDDKKFDNYNYTENQKKNISLNGIKIMIDDVLYNSMTEAGVKLSLSRNTISRRVKSNDVKFENYKYV
jgi:hypothetical protein